ncbi:MAG: hypothetical protein ABR958_03095 [Dehalococcoidales bacterium]
MSGNGEQLLPFDFCSFKYFSDTKSQVDLHQLLRGVQLPKSLLRQPDKLLEAMEAIVPLMIKMGVGAAQMNGKPLIFMPLRKGADGFFSDGRNTSKYMAPFYAKTSSGNTSVRHGTWLMMK